MATDGSYFTAYNLARAAIPRVVLRQKWHRQRHPARTRHTVGIVSGDGLTSQPVEWYRLARLAGSEVSPLANPKLAAVAVTLPDEIDLANAET